MDAHFFVRSGYEYYANATFAMHAQSSYVCGNLFHHAVEMLFEVRFGKERRISKRVAAHGAQSQKAMARIQAESPQCRPVMP
jgi:hypothetical protein